ncbi:MAG: DUF2142 domain-containing protein [Acidobacteria bacterium]|nr:MAG: DUF2142 domain-containing protein [Acidobacteriota bacterium]
MAAYASLFQGCRPIWEPDEGRYTAVAVQMLESGDWIHPRLHPAHPHYSKPPFTYWALAASLAVFGRNEWAARMPNALALAALIAIAARLGRRFAPRAGWAAGFAVATMPGPLVAANVVTTDTLLAAWEALGALGFVTAWWAGDERQRRRGAFLMWTAFGMAFLTKGPPGLLPLLAFAVFALLERRWQGLAAFRSAAGLAAFAVLAFGWFAVVIAQEPVLLRYFLFNEFVERIASGVHRRNPEWYGPFKAYLPGLLLGSLPWTLPAMKGLGRGLADLRRRSPGAAAEDRLLALWVGVPLVVLSLAKSRLPLYVLPLFLPLALLAVRRLPFPESPRLRGARMWTAAALALATLGLRAVPWHPAPHRDALRASREIAELAGAVPAEVLFVDTRPWYGLSFYMGTQVDRARLHPVRLPDGRDEALARHLERAIRGPRLVAGWPQLLDEIREQARSRGYAVEPLGIIDGLLFCRLGGER